MIKKKLLSEAIKTAYVNIPEATINNKGLLPQGLYQKAFQTLSAGGNKVWRFARLKKSWTSVNIKGVMTTGIVDIVDAYILVSNIDNGFSPDKIKVVGQTSDSLRLYADNDGYLYLNVSMGTDIDLELISTDDSVMLPVVETALPENVTRLTVQKE